MASYTTSWDLTAMGSGREVPVRDSIRQYTARNRISVRVHKQRSADDLQLKSSKRQASKVNANAQAVQVGEYIFYD
jgi:hypothetical protein